MTETREVAAAEAEAEEAVPEVAEDSEEKAEAEEVAEVAPETVPKKVVMLSHLVMPKNEIDFMVLSHQTDLSFNFQNLYKKIEFYALILIIYALFNIPKNY